LETVTAALEALRHPKAAPANSFASLGRFPHHGNAATARGQECPRYTGWGSLP